VGNEPGIRTYSHYWGKKIPLSNNMEETAVLISQNIKKVRLPFAGAPF